MTAAVSIGATRLATADALLTADFAVARRSIEVEARLSLVPGQRLSLFGASGAGKTTILEAIGGTVSLRRGEVRLDNRLVNADAGSWRARLRGRPQPVAMRRRGIAVVRQPTTLFPHLSVWDNAAYGLKDDHAVRETLARVGLEQLHDAKPGMLSGGQRQRVCLARALARPFRALLLDEPVSAIDFSSRPELRQLTMEVVARQEAVALLVTHDLTEAQAFGHQIAVVDEGRILQIADAGSLVRRPATKRVADLCGYTGYLDRAEGGMWALHPDRFLPGAHPELGIVLSGTVVSVQAFGSGFACDLVGVTVAGTSDTRPEPAGVTPALRISVHVDAPPEVGMYSVVTALDPPLLSRVTSAEEQEG